MAAHDGSDMVGLYSEDNIHLPGFLDRSNKTFKFILSLYYLEYSYTYGDN